MPRTLSSLPPLATLAALAATAALAAPVFSQDPMEEDPVPSPAAGIPRR